MSVQIISDEDYQKLFNTLVRYQERNRIRIFTSPEINDYIELLKSAKDDQSEYDLRIEAIQTKVATFVRNLKAANVSAHNHSYEVYSRNGGHIQITSLNIAYPDGKIFNPVETWDILSKIEYNAISNDGFDFLSQDVRQKLNIIMLALGESFRKFIEKENLDCAKIGV